MASKRRRTRADGVERSARTRSGVVPAPQAEAPREWVMPEPRIRQSSVREVSWSEFDRYVQSLAARIREEFKPDAVVGVAHGGVFVGGALASALGVLFFPVRISRRSRDRVSPRKKPQATGEMPAELADQRVLLVDDVAASGETLELGKSLLEKRKAKAVATACLVSRDQGYAPDFFAFKEERLVVFPWDYDLIDDARFAPRGVK